MSFSKRSRGAAVAILAAGVLVAVLSAAGQAATAKSKFSASSAGLSQAGSSSGLKSVTGRLARTDPAVLKLAGSKLTPVMVKLDYDPLASYGGNIAGYAATSPRVTHHALNPDSAASRKYLGYVSGEVEDLELEELQGVHGLRALRATVALRDVPAEPFAAQAVRAVAR